MGSRAILSTSIRLVIHRTFTSKRDRPPKGQGQGASTWGPIGRGPRSSDRRAAAKGAPRLRRHPQIYELVKGKRLSLRHWATFRPSRPGLFTALYPYTLRGIDTIYPGAFAFQLMRIISLMGSTSGRMQHQQLPLMVKTPQFGSLTRT